MSDSEAKTQESSTLRKQWPKLPPALLLLGSALTFLANNFETTKNALENWVKLPSSVQLSLAALIGIIALPWLSATLQKKSRLQRFDEFQKRVFGHDMFGREEEKQKLASLCQQARLIFVVGESGVGKSTLLREGLIKEIKNSAHIVYMQNWGLDIEEGPKMELVNAIRSQAELEPSVRSALLKLLCPWSLDNTNEMTARPAESELLHSKRIVVILDQFDEYQMLHRAYFTGTGDGAWISADELCKLEFWSNLRKLVQQERITCVLAARSDTRMEPVWLSDPKIYTIGRFHEAEIATMLEKLMADRDGKSFIEHPAHGWEQLRDELKVDLLRAGAGALPVRVKLALGGLATLGTLTPKDYARKMRLSGLEAACVKGKVDKIATSARFSSDTVLSILLELVGKKGELQSLDARKIAEEVSDPRGSSRSQDDWIAAIQNVLKECEVQDISRKHMDDASPKRELWTLKHDFWAEALQNAKLSRDAHFHALEQRKKQYDEALGYWQRWTELLSVGEQFGFFLLWVRGKLKYRSLRGYALLSMAKFIPSIFLAAALSLNAGFGLRWALTAHFAVRITVPYLPGLVLRGPQWAKLSVLKAFGEYGIYHELDTIRAHELIDAYVKAATPDEKMRLVKEVLVPCALAKYKIPGRNLRYAEYCSTKALDLSKEKAATAKALTPAYLQLDSSIQTRLIGHLNAEDWKEVAQGMLGRLVEDTDFEKKGSYWGKQVVERLLSSPKRSVMGMRAAFVIDTLCPNKGTPNPGQLFIALSFKAALDQQGISLSEAQQQCLTAKIARELPACTGRLCNEAVDPLMKSYALLGSSEKREMEAQLFKIMSKNVKDWVSLLSGLCLSGWSPLEEAPDLRAHLEALLPGDGKLPKGDTKSAVAWACVHAHAPREFRKLAAKRVNSWLPGAQPGELSDLTYAFVKLKDELDEDERSRARRFFVRRFLDPEVMDVLESRSILVGVFAQALEGANKEEMDRILHDLFEGMEAQIGTNRWPWQIPSLIGWLRALSAGALQTDDPKWRDLSKAAILRLDQAWDKSWAGSLSRALPPEIRRVYAQKLYDEIVRHLSGSPGCSAAPSQLDDLATVCALIGNNGCALALETISKAFEDEGPCTKEGHWFERSMKSNPFESTIAQISDVEQRKALIKTFAQRSCLHKADSNYLKVIKPALQALCQGPTQSACQPIHDELTKAGCTNPKSLATVLPKPD